MNGRDARRKSVEGVVCYHHDVVEDRIGDCVVPEMERFPDAGRVLLNQQTLLLRRRAKISCHHLI